MKNKTIFLDIDGVICLDELIDDFHVDVFCYDSVRILNEICIETGAEIIISSDWRNNNTLPELKILLQNQGVTGRIVGVTPTIKFTNAMFLERDRVSEIEEYIKDNNVTDYVIIDDMQLYGEFIPTGKNDRFVQTLFYVGLKQKGLKEKILNILN